MTNTVSNVIAGSPELTGAAFNAPLGTTLPTSSTAALNSAFVGLGFVSSDGLEEATERSTETIRDWAGRAIKVVQTEFGTTLTLRLVEALNADVLKTVYGEGNVTSTPANASHGTQHAIEVKADQLPHQAWVFSMKDGDATSRIVVPDGQVTAIEPISYTQADVVGYNLTISAFPDENGAFLYKYLDDGVKTTAGGGS